MAKKKSPPAKSPRLNFEAGQYENANDGTITEFYYQGTQLMAKRITGMNAGNPARNVIDGQIEREMKFNCWTKIV